MKMGSDTTNTINSNQTVVNQMLQASKSTCYAGCKNIASNVTIIVIGGSGDINAISQECKLTNINCVMKNSFNVQIENIIKSMLAQSATAMSGFSLDWAHISNNVDIYQYIQNTITQMMDTSCLFEAGNEATGLYMYVQDRNGNIAGISQGASITNATCNMDNIAKAVTYNDESAKADQKSTVFNIFSLLFIAMIVCILVAGVVLVVFLLTGGVKSIASAAGAQAGAGGPTINPSDIAAVVAKNPQLLAMI